MNGTSVMQKFDLVKLELSSLETELTEEQLDFILHPASQSSYLKACPGSGKTEVVGIKAAYEISKWQENFSGIAILSFTKNAAKEISDRVNKYGGAKALTHPHYIGTIDSWIHGYILQPFGYLSSGFTGKNNDKSFRLVDNKTKYDYLNSFKTILSYDPYKEAHVNEYYFECSEPLNIQTQSRTFDLKNVTKENIQDLEKNKKRFLKAGLTTYADAEFLCYYFLKRHKDITRNIVKRFPIIFIDECQDLSNNQIEILTILRKAGAVIHFVGDNNQSIYEFKKVYVEKINHFIKENNLIEKLLTQNFRSNKEIIQVTQNIERINTGLIPEQITAHQPKILNSSCLLWEYNEEDFLNLPQKFIDFIENVNSQIKDTETKIDISNSGILARGHSILSEFRNKPNSRLSKIELIVNALNCWSNNNKSTKDIEDALNQLGKAISILAYNGKGNHQHQFCPEPYNQVEWRFQLIDILKNLKKPEHKILPFSKLTWKDWTKNLKTFLRFYWPNLISPENDWEEIKNKIKSPSGLSNNLVENKFRNKKKKYSKAVRMTTFHDIKGETLDAILMVSTKDKKSKGGHYEHWVSEKADEKEYVRFAYVGSSRPKHLLIWAIPKKEKNKFRNKIYDLGFSST